MPIKTLHDNSGFSESKSTRSYVVDRRDLTDEIVTENVTYNCLCHTLDWRVSLSLFKSWHALTGWDVILEILEVSAPVKV